MYTYYVLYIYVQESMYKIFIFAKLILTEATSNCRYRRPYGILINNLRIQSKLRIVNIRRFRFYGNMPFRHMINVLCKRATDKLLGLSYTPGNQANSSHAGRRAGQCALILYNFIAVFHALIREAPYKLEKRVIDI